jgi:hypothetical protein
VRSHQLQIVSQELQIVWQPVWHSFDQPLGLSPEHLEPSAEEWMVSNNCPPLPPPLPPLVELMLKTK